MCKGSAPPADLLPRRGDGRNARGLPGTGASYRSDSAPDQADRAGCSAAALIAWSVPRRFVLRGCRASLGGGALTHRLPDRRQQELKPWSLDETLDFLAASRRDPLYAAFVLAITMGLRRGEIIGLRWSDLDLESGVLYVRQQTQRRRGVLYDDDPKSRRRRVVLLPALCIAPLRWHRMRQSAARAKAGEQWHESGYVFTTRTGRQVEPRNVYRSFTRVAESAGLRVIRLHDARHGTATLLTAAGVAPRVVMEILGHSQISITMDVYTHVVQDTQREAISHMDRLLKRRPVVSDRQR